MFNLKQGEFLVKLARNEIKSRINNEKYESKNIPKEFNKKAGVFVSLHIYPNNELRGCVGFPEPIYNIVDAVRKASIASAFEDLRFPPLKKEELNKILIEVSILTKPKLIEFKSPDDLLKKISNKEGYILKFGYSSGLFLPQVWEHFSNKEDFLNALCEKSGVPWGTWMDQRAKIYGFDVQIFKEPKPNGRIIEEKI